MRKFLTATFIICLFPAAVSAQEAPPTEAPAAASAADRFTTDIRSDDSTLSDSQYRVKMDVKESRLIFGLYGQMSQFERKGVSLVGYNFEGLGDYAITERTAVQISINQSLDMANSISVLFTGIRLGGAYSFWGDFIHRNSMLRVNNQETMTVRTADSSLLAGDFGIEQYLFNGTDRIVPATGISLGVRYDKTFWGLRGSFMFRYGSLVISEDPVSMLTAGAGVLMRF